MTDRDRVLDRAIKQEVDTALAHLVFDDRLKAAVRKKVAEIEALPPTPAKVPAWRRWQPYAWGTLAAAAVTGVVMMNSYRSGLLTPPTHSGSRAPAAASAPAPTGNDPRAVAAPQGTQPNELSNNTPGNATPPAPAPQPFASSSIKPPAVAALSTAPVAVEITPQAGSVLAGQPLSFTIKVTATGDTTAALGTTAPRLVIKSMGTRNQTTAQVPVPDLAGKQLASRGAQVTAQAVWNGAVTPGYYTVSLEGLNVANAQGSLSLSPGGQPILVRYPNDDVLVKAFTPNKANTAQDITVTVQRVETDLQHTQISIRFDGVPGTVNETTITLQRDGQEVLVPLRTDTQQIPGGVVLTAEFNPLPSNTKSLNLTVSDLQVPGANGALTTVTGPWQVTVNP